MSEPIKKRTRLKQFIIIFTPFFILTLLFVGFNFWPGWLNQIIQPAVTEVDSDEGSKAVGEPDLVEAKQGDGAIAITATAVSITSIEPTVTMQPTPAPQPTLSPEASITLMGPPEESIFPNKGNITFYWRWPLTLTENQQFALTSLNGNQEQQIATINEQNLGQQYALTIDSGKIELTEPNAIVSWQIQLIDSDSGTVLAQSEQRALALVSQSTE